MPDGGRTPVSGRTPDGGRTLDGGPAPASLPESYGRVPHGTPPHVGDDHATRRPQRTLSLSERALT